MHLLLLFEACCGICVLGCPSMFVLSVLLLNKRTLRTFALSAEGDWLAKLNTHNCS